MVILPKIRNYVVIKSRKELQEAKRVYLCMFIILEENNIIFIWTKIDGKWKEDRYVLYGQDNEKDFETTGSRAYQSFYDYVGKEKVEEMKHILKPIEIWESYEQMHYSNYEFAEQKIYEDIYEFDANSAFTYGVMQLPSGFEPLKEYMQLLYDKKETSTNKITRSKYKNLQNYLIGYFARVKDFVKVRSEVIRESNFNINKKMLEITKNGGKVYLSNTDSIITNSIGAEIMDKYIGEKVGQFKIACTSNKLFYKSSNAYQIGDKVIYSGISYFARRHTDFFKDEIAEQNGSFIIPFDFSLEDRDLGLSKLCRVSLGVITVEVFNKIGEKVGNYVYTPNIGD